MQTDGNNISLSALAEACAKEIYRHSITVSRNESAFKAIVLAHLQPLAKDREILNWLLAQNASFIVCDDREEVGEAYEIEATREALVEAMTKHPVTESNTPKPASSS